MAGDVFSTAGMALTNKRLSYGGTILSRSETTVGNVGVGEDTLHTYTVPAASLAADGDRIKYEAYLSFAANGNNKRVRAYFGSTVILDTGTVTYNNLTAWCELTVIRTGAATQTCFARLFGASVTTIVANTSASETLANALAIRLTGEATSNDDIRQFISEIWFVTPRA